MGAAASSLSVGKEMASLDLWEQASDAGTRRSEVHYSEVLVGGIPTESLKKFFFHYLFVLNHSVPIPLLIGI